MECRRYTTTKQNQGKAASLAYQIIDTGASGGIIVSPLGLQKGARKIAAAQNIMEVHLDPNSTPQDFAMQFLNKIMLGFSDSFTVKDDADAELHRKCTVCAKRFTPKGNEKACPACSAKQTQ